MAISGNQINADTLPVYVDNLRRASNDDNIVSGKLDLVDNALLGLFNNLVSKRRPANVSVMSGSLVVEAAPAAGGAFSFANPTGGDCFVLDVVVDVTTQTTGVATVDVGVAANATTSDDTLIDGGDIGTGAITLNNILHAGTNGLRSIKMTSAQFVTATASADSTGLVATYAVSLLKA
tara:strand:- start:438 stop:971 length:534 start_codon:yes stop_codon:yes gene_type:complete